jgi:hypothetical protein
MQCARVCCNTAPSTSASNAGTDARQLKQERPSPACVLGAETAPVTSGSGASETLSPRRAHIRSCREHRCSSIMRTIAGFWPCSKRARLDRTRTRFVEPAPSSGAWCCTATLCAMQWWRRGVCCPPSWKSWRLMCRQSKGRCWPTAAASCSASSRTSVKNHTPRQCVDDPIAAC